MNQALGDFLVQFSNSTPLNIIAELCLDFDATAAGDKILTAYEQFLEILSDSSMRSHLDKLPTDRASGDEVFQRTREIGNLFQAGLTKLFFNSNIDLTKATQRYGVF